MTTPAGWYADPSDATAVRWWSGIAWTEHAAPAPQVAVPTYVPSIAMAGAASGAPVYTGIQPYSIDGQGPIAEHHYVAPGVMSTDIPDPRTMKRGAREKQLRRVNPVAYAGLLLGVLSFLVPIWGLTPLAAIILGAIGLSRANRLRRMGHLIHGRGYSIAGLVLGIVLFLWDASRVILGIIASPGFQAGFNAGLNGH